MYENQTDSFYDYLIENEYLFGKETIENYLLSLKVKPFAILTGNSGTGKTKLSQLFANYISEKKYSSDNFEDFITVKASTTEASWKTVNKSGKPKKPGWTLSNNDFLELLPIKEIWGKFKIEVDGVKGEATIEPLIQIYYDRDNSEFQKEFENLHYKEEQIKKENKGYKQYVDLQINMKSLKNIIKKDFKNNYKDVTFRRRTIEADFQRGGFTIPVEISNQLPFYKKYDDCKIISLGKFSNASFEFKFRLRALSQNIREYLKEKGKGTNVEYKIKNFCVDLEKFKPNYAPIKKYSNEQISQLNEKDIELIDFNSKNYKIIPVGANWTENRHIVGYYNVITEKYQATPSYDLIKESNELINEPYFLILDEMNLSHVERYFADFLSAIESGEKIPLYGEAELTLPENLFIIGTVNVDETTYMFSPKVLDRANVIEFETYSAKDYMMGNFNLSAPNGNIEYLENPLSDTEIRKLGIDKLKEIFDNVTVDGEDFWDVLTNEIYCFQRILKKSGFDFGFRVINEIVRFMAVAWKYENEPPEFTNWERYFDTQIKQKMLPKLHGSEKIIGDTLNALHDKCSDSSFEIKELEKYPSSAAKLKEMIDILDKQRYVSFIN